MVAGEAVVAAKRVELGAYITDHEPFGPVSSDDITQELWCELFDRENQVYANLRAKNPAYVIGRRGAGKTAFLRASAAEDPNVNVRLHTASAITEVARLLRVLGSDGQALPPESVADVWDAVMWHGIFGSLVLYPNGNNPFDARQVERIRFYLEDLIGGLPVRNPQRLLAIFCRQFAEQAETNQMLVSDPTAFAVKGVYLDEMIEVASELFNATDEEPVVLMDSMEDFRDVLTLYTDTFTGLFMRIGRAAQPSAPYRVRFSFPAELIHRLQGMSANPPKDFSKRIFLHWSSREIAQIAAYRFHRYLQLHHAEELQARPELARLSTFGRDSALDLLKSVLPATVRGEVGVGEDTIAYVLRHTQLLPRQLLWILNEVWSKNASNGGSPLAVSEAAVIEGIRTVEKEIVDEIFKAYELVHPLAKEACRAIVKHLPRRFDNSKLHEAFNQHGKAALRRAYDESVEQRATAAMSVDYDLVSMDYFQFRAMLGEVGCIGRLFKETERYSVAYFEYAIPGRLELGDRDEFCVHPLFSGVFQALDDRDTHPKVVYAYGSDPDEDHRLSSPRLMGTERRST